MMHKYVMGVGQEPMYHYILLVIKVRSGWKDQSQSAGIPGAQVYLMRNVGGG